MSLLPPPRIDKLESEFGILHLVYHRSHNQHRVAVWWRHLNLIHRKIRHVVQDLRALENTHNPKKRAALRRQIVGCAAYLVHKNIMKKALYEFHSIIALGQFINLGLVLVGSVSAIYGVLVEIDGVDDFHSARISRRPVLAVADDDIGEEIEVGHMPVHGEFRERSGEKDGSKTTKTEKLEKKLKNSIPLESKSEGISPMDAIFGDRPKKRKTDRKEGEGDKERRDKKDKKRKKKSKSKNAIDDIFG